MGNTYKNFGIPLTTKNLVVNSDIDMGSYDVTATDFKGNLTGNVTGNVSGKVIVNGCTWGNDPGSWTDLEQSGLVTIISGKSVASYNTTPNVVSEFISYPYLGCIDFQPKPASPAITLTIQLAGSSQGVSIGGQLDVIGADGTTVLRSYRKDSAVGTFTFPVDLTDAYKLVLTSQGYTNVTVTTSINSLYVKLPYSESLVDV